jgi:hypothetical protein
MMKTLFLILMLPLAAVAQDRTHETSLGPYLKAYAASTGSPYDRPLFGATARLRASNARLEALSDVTLALESKGGTRGLHVETWSSVMARVRMFRLGAGVNVQTNSQYASKTGAAPYLALGVVGKQARVDLRILPNDFTLNKGREFSGRVYVNAGHSWAVVFDAGVIGYKATFGSERYLNPFVGVGVVRRF